jgi:hypothetical protein
MKEGLNLSEIVIMKSCLFDFQIDERLSFPKRFYFIIDGEVRSKA